MLRALLVSVAAGSLAPAALADERFVETSSFDAASGESSEADDGLLPAGWSETACVGSCAPSESLLCDDCGDLPHQFRQGNDRPNWCACGRIDAIAGYSPVHTDQLGGAA